MKTSFFIDAQQMKKEHPDTFEAPDLQELDSLKIDDYVKVCAIRERFGLRFQRLKTTP